MNIQEQLIHVARCLAEAEKRLSAVEKQPDGPRHADFNRLQAEVGELRRELSEAHARIADAGKREFAAKQDELSAKLDLGLTKIRRDLAESVRGLNPRGEWERGMVLNRNDVVSVSGSSYLVLRDGVTVKPSSKDTENFQLLAKRGGVGGFAGGGVGYVSPPATASSSGQVGSFSYDNQYYYVCVANNTWLRTSLAIW